MRKQKKRSKTVSGCEYECTRYILLVLPQQEIMMCTASVRFVAAGVHVFALCNAVLVYEYDTRNETKTLLLRRTIVNRNRNRGPTVYTQKPIYSYIPVFALSVFGIWS